MPGMEWMRSLRPLRRIALCFACLCLASGLSGCLYLGHHFNTGETLEAGHTRVTLGVGKTNLYSAECPEPGYHLDWTSRCVNYGVGQDTLGQWLNSDTIDPVLEPFSVPKVSLGYRLGVRGKWGPFTGVELGWHIEAPTNPASLAFDFKFGLPAPARFAMRHSLSAGWIVGMWADNSTFLEYAVSRAFGRSALYSNYCVTYLATQPPDVTASISDFRFVRRQRLTHQAAFGFNWALPKIRVIPDYFNVQAVGFYPLAPLSDANAQVYLDEAAWNMGFGFGWHFE